MKTAIIYYSRTGNTKKIAHLLEEKIKQKRIDVDLIQIEAEKKPGFFKAGSAAMKEKDLPIKNAGVDLKSYDILLVGSPTWTGRPTPFIKTFFSSAKNTKGKRAAIFMTGNSVPGSKPDTRMMMKHHLENAGLIVSDAFLGIQMEKDTIKQGADQVDEFLSKLFP